METSRPRLLAPGAGDTWLALLQGLRPKQWTKNGVIFAALVFDVRLFDPLLFTRTAAAFVIFCFLSGSIYLVNDLVDVQKDRAHPSKRRRPIASGRLPVALARQAVLFIWALAFPSAYLLGPAFFLVALAYVLLMLAYQRVLKHYVLVDVFTLAGGFVLRAVAGAVVIDVPISPWLYLVTVLLALFLGFAKRRHELLLLEEQANNHRPALEQYSASMLDHMILVVAASTIMAYSLYTFTAPNLPSNHAMMATVPLVIYGLFRYFFLIHHQANGGGPPDHLLLTDRPLLTGIFLWGLTTVAILYLFNDASIIAFR